MKMRKTIYPIALIISIPLVLLVFYILNQGKFEKIDDPSNELDTDGTLFLKYDLGWQGFGKPIIKSITAAGDTNLEMNAFIALDSDDKQMEQTVEKVSEAEYYMEIDDYKLQESNFSLVIEVQQDGSEKIKGMHALHIRYKTFGIIREQEIPIENTGTME